MFLCYYKLVVNCRLIHVKIRELQGQDTSEDIPDEVFLFENEAEQLAKMQSDTHIAKPDAVSLNEEPPPPPEESPSPEKSVPLTSLIEKDASPPPQKDGEGSSTPTTDQRARGDGEESPASTTATETASDSPSKDVVETTKTQEDAAGKDVLLTALSETRPKFSVGN